MYYLYSNDKGYWDGSEYTQIKTNALAFSSYEVAFNHRFYHGLNDLSIVE